MLTDLDLERFRKMRAFVQDEFLPGETFLGSELGSHFAPFLRPLRANDYGGLRVLVDAHFSDVLQWIARTPSSPGDDIYRAHRPSECVIDKELITLTGATSDFWEIYSRPRKTGTITYDLQSHTLAFVSPRHAPPPGTTVIAHADDDAYRQLIQAFAKCHISRDLRDDVRTILGLDRTYSAWIGLLRRVEPKNVLARWERARAAMIENKLRNELIAANAPPHIVRELVAMLARSRARYGQPRNRRVRAQSANALSQRRLHEGHVDAR